MVFEAVGNTKYLHGIAMTIAWGVLAPIGIIAVRYFKHSTWWFYVHLLTLLTAALITLISSESTFGVDSYSLSTIPQATLEHSRLGMILASIVASQVVFGMMTSYFKIATKNFHAVTLIRRAHKIVGYGLLISGFINCIKGWEIINNTGGLVLYALALIVITILFAYLEIRQLCFKNKKIGAPEELPEMTHFEAMEKVANKEELMFADDMVVDVKHFQKSHPGGSYMIHDSVGEDAGKYMIGCSSYGGSMNPYTHSANALSMLRNIAIAKIPYPVGDLAPQDSTSNNNSMDFTLVEKQQLNEHTFMFTLKSDFFKMSRECSNPAWLGKHYKVTFRTKFGVVSRYYSSLFVNLNEWSRELGLLNEEIKLQQDGVVKFIFKVYQGGAMTTFLNKLKPGENIHLNGPLGPGLMINNIRGNCIALAGGTGLVPFLDLVYCAWKQMAEHSQGFNLTLFVSFKNRKDGFALEILEKMRSMYEGDWLNVIIMTDENPDKKRIPEVVKKMLSTTVDKAWVCGPSGFNRYYYELLIELGLDRSVIIMM